MTGNGNPRTPISQYCLTCTNVHVCQNFVVVVVILEFPIDKTKIIVQYHVRNIPNMQQVPSHM
jgi:hypothetical protein